MADAPDSKSGRGNPVRVQVPPPAPNNSSPYAVRLSFHPLLHPQIVRPLSVLYSPAVLLMGTTTGVFGCAFRYA